LVGRAAAATVPRFLHSLGALRVPPGERPPRPRRQAVQMCLSGPSGGYGRAQTVPREALALEGVFGAVSV